MKEIRRAISSDAESIMLLYEKAFDRSEGVLKCYKGFLDYVDFCIKQRYAYITVNEGTICGVLLANEKPDIFAGKAVCIELLVVMLVYHRRGIGELSLRTGCYMDSYKIYKKYGFRYTR